MSNLAFHLSIEYSVACHCVHEGCGIPIVMSTIMNQKLHNSHEWFYCLNGHSQRWTGETEAERLQKLLDTERRWLENQKKVTENQRQRAATAEKSLAATKGVVTRLKNRSANGLCPCCNRSFQNLKKHMATKHPEQVKAAGRDV